MKKYLSLFLACVLLLLPMGVIASALPLSDGTAALNRQFLNGKYGSYDYVYFSPVKGEDDAVKYPLTVWLHGRNSGGYARAQLERYEFSNWASDEYQARFENAGGCFLLCRSPVCGCVLLACRLALREFLILDHDLDSVNRPSVFICIVVVLQSSLYHHLGSLM